MRRLLARCIAHSAYLAGCMSLVLIIAIRMFEVAIKTWETWQWAVACVWWGLNALWLTGLVVWVREAGARGCERSPFHER